ncbi:MAG: helix-turn-helix domain-containing protein [Flavobacterium sp.]|uniref:helix-turn-helix domain-containing protein n=1 Tax=Flavobacterium sp. TaxID=239 RepID=UPI002FCB1C72
MDKEAQQRVIIPNYKRIYEDLLDRKYPHKKEVCKAVLAKEKLNSMDVFLLNDLIFDKEARDENESDQKYRSYDKTSIFKILQYQKKNKLNNTQLADHFGLSRNTVAKWKKMFQF